MKKSTKIRIAISVLLFAIGLAASIVFDGVLTGPDSQMWQRGVYIFAVIGSMVSAVAGLVFGTKGYLYGFLWVVAMALPIMLPWPWGGIFCAAYIGSMLIWSAVQKRKRTAEDASEDSEPELTEEERLRLEEFASKNVVLNPWNSRFYRLCCKDKELRMCFVGDQFRGVDDELMQKAGESDLLGTKDAAIPLEDIRWVRIRGAQAVLKTGKKKYRLNCVPGAAGESYERFWRDVLPGKVTAAVKAQPKKEELPVPAPAPERAKVFKAVKLGLGIYMAVVNLVWLFIGVPYNLLAVLSVIALPIILLLYLCFPNDISIIDGRKGDRRVNLSGLIVFAGLIPALRSMLTFNLISYGRLAVLGIVVFVLLMAAVLIGSKECRRKVSSVLILVFVLGFYAPSLVMQINAVFDNGQYRVEQSVITSLSRSRSRYHTSYRARFELDGREMSAEISREEYATYEKGDEIDVYIFPGALDIPYYFIVD